MKNFVKIFASILLIVLGNALIYPLGFWLCAFIAVQIPELNTFFTLWIVELMTAVPTAAVFVLMRRLLNRLFNTDIKKNVMVLSCALPSLVISVVMFFAALKKELVRGGMDIDADVIVAFFAVPYSVFCILVISAAFGAEYFIGCLIERRRGRM